MEAVVTTGAVRDAKLQTNRHHQQINTQLFTGQLPLLLTNQQCQSTGGKSITLHGIVHSNLSCGLPTLYLTTKCSWLPLGRAVKPIVSPLLTVLQLIRLK